MMPSTPSEAASATFSSTAFWIISWVAVICAIASGLNICPRISTWRC